MHLPDPWFGHVRQPRRLVPNLPFPLINQDSPEARGLQLWVNAVGATVPSDESVRMTLDHSVFGRHSEGVGSPSVSGFPSIVSTEFGLPALNGTDNTSRQDIFLNQNVYVGDGFPWTLTWIARLDATTGFPTIAMLPLSGISGAELEVFYSTGSYGDIFHGAPTGLVDEFKYAMPASISVTGEYHWAVITYDGVDATAGSSFKCFVNGQSLTQSSGGALGAVTPNDTNVLMNLPSRTDSTFAGNILDFRIYDYAWSASLAMRYYRHGFDLYSLPTTSVYYKQPAAVGGFIPYPNPRYGMTGGMQPMAGGMQ